MLQIIAVPAFNDNYLWLFHLPGSQQAYVVDPGDAQPVEAALTRHDLQLAGILVTHHHLDHTGGIAHLLAERDIPVYGPLSDKIPAITHPLHEGQRLSLDSGLDFDILEVPGHTLDHIAYFSAAHQTLFCGDTLFAGGCGRMFEGQPRQMQASLSKLAQLPVDTRVYCAHEYTQANLEFAVAVEPDNAQLQQRVQRVKGLRSEHKATVPSTIQQELQTNPFLRVAEQSVIEAAKNHNHSGSLEPWEVFAVLRRWKDNF